MTKRHLSLLPCPPLLKQNFVIIREKASDGWRVLTIGMREIARFAPALNVTVLNEQDDRADSLSDIGEYDVVLTTYGLLVREKEALTAVDWNVVCLDEGRRRKYSAA